MGPSDCPAGMICGNDFKCVNQPVRRPRQVPEAVAKPSEDFYGRRILAQNAGDFRESLAMIVDRHISFLRLLKVMWRRLVAIGAMAVSTVLISRELNLEDWSAGIDLAIPMVLGTALAIFLGFRTNSGYERWWEGRKLWGAIINDTRSTARLFRDFLGTTAEPDEAGNWGFG